MVHISPIVGSAVRGYAVPFLRNGLLGFSLEMLDFVILGSIKKLTERVLGKVGAHCVALPVTALVNWGIVSKFPLVAVPNQKSIRLIVGSLIIPVIVYCLSSKQKDKEDKKGQSVAFFNATLSTAFAVSTVGAGALAQYHPFLAKVLSVATPLVDVTSQPTIVRKVFKKFVGRDLF